MIELNKKQLRLLELVFNSAQDSLENVYGYITSNGNKDESIAIATSEEILNDMYELWEILKTNIKVKNNKE